MEKLNIYKAIKRVHIIGIGGISLSAIAKLLKHNGICVSGSDNKDSSVLADLKAMGIKVTSQHSLKNISKDIDIVIYSLAISPDNPELKKAQKLGIKCIKRGEALGLIAQNYSHVIAIAGMHGKTTTTALIYHIFKSAGLNPTLHIGGEIDIQNKNLVIGNKDYFITEACEYGDSFLSLRPDTAVINNVEREHLDYFGNLKNIYKSFNVFMLQSKKCFIDYKQRTKLVTTKECYFDGGYWRAEKIRKQKIGYSFDVYKEDVCLGRVSLGIEGKYNIHNALASIAVADSYNIPIKTTFNAISTFRGVKRRFERVGRIEMGEVIFDYAHHPTEIKNAIKTAINLKQGKVYIYFQPHTYSRTKSLKDLFEKCFEGADSVFICSTFKAREDYDPEADEKALSRLISKVKHHNIGSGDIGEVLKDVKAKKENGVFLFVGAGDMQDKVKNILLP